MKKKSDTITNRELEVLKLVAKGYTTKEIGSILSIASTTVKTHRNTLRSKLCAKNCIELVYIATKYNLI